MSYFTDRRLKEFDQHISAIDSKYHKLLLTLNGWPFASISAQEYARHGFMRRMKTILRCVHNVFDIVPPDHEGIPTGEQLTDCTINLQSFLLNVYGAVDNLAWILVYELGISCPDGSDLPNRFVGLRKVNKLVRSSLSVDFQTYLETIDEWFDHLENFRHALAHRIPIYIPPHIVPKSKEPAYQDLESQKLRALARFDMDEHDRLDAEQVKLVIFRPWMTHSFSEVAPTVIFHGQIIQDFQTLEALAWKAIGDLESHRDSQQGPSI